MNIDTSNSFDFTNDLLCVRRSEAFYGFEWRKDSLTLSRLHGCRELLQAILSQAGSYLLTGKFHEHCDFAIGKAEGGFIIPDRGEFIPTQDCIAMDPPSRRTHRLSADADCVKLAGLLAEVALKWDAARHEDSMYDVAAAHAGTTSDALRIAVESNRTYQMRISYLHNGQAFGNPISYFFGWNKSDAISCDEKYRNYWLKSSRASRAISADSTRASLQ